MSGRPPSTATALATLARLTLVRLARGKLLWVSLAIAFLPIARAAGVPDKSNMLETTFAIEMFVLAILPPLFVAPSIGEEIEDRTATYLWSRPLARWTILAGKLLALAPLSMAVIVASWIASIELGSHTLPPVASIVGLAVGALALSVVTAGIATVVPKHGMALSIIYILMFDLPFGAIPGSIRLVSVTNAAAAVAGIGDDTSPLTGAIALIVIAGVWIAVAFRRIGRLET